MLVESLWKAAMWRCHRWSLIERMSKLHQLAPRNQFMVKYSNVWILFNIFKLFELKHTAKWNGLLAGGWDINEADQREVVAGQRWMAADRGALTQWSSVLDRFDLWGHSGLTQPSIIAEMKKNAPAVDIQFISLIFSPFALLYLNTFKRLHKL